MKKCKCDAVMLHICYEFANNDTTTFYWCPKCGRMLEHTERRRGTDKNEWRTPEVSI